MAYIKDEFFEDEFIELIKCLKKSGIATSFIKAASGNEWRSTWQTFLKNNQELRAKIISWASRKNKEKFEDSEFMICNKFERIKYPIEVCAFIYLTEGRIRKSDIIFMDCMDNFIQSIRNIGGDNAIQLASYAEENDIHCIGCEDIFEDPMRQSFLEIIEEIKESGITSKFIETSNKEEWLSRWNEFLRENSQLCLKIQSWAIEYSKKKHNQSLWIFHLNDDYPLEVQAFLYLTDGIVKRDDLFYGADHYRLHLSFIMKFDDEKNVKALDKYLSCRDYLQGYAKITSITLEDVFD